MTTPAKLYGLVLAGGKSTRMGTDKGLLAYHGKPQREYLYDLLVALGIPSFYSVRADQLEKCPKESRTILDQDRVKGPFNGLLSAHRTHPDVAWLVLACDLPLIDADALGQLIAARDPERMATTLALSENPLPEPLCAIWEPTGLGAAESYLDTGHGTCPRKFLIANGAHLVFPENERVLLNANSEADYHRVLNLLGNP